MIEETINDLDPFANNDNEKKTPLFLTESIIEIWFESRGRKSDTYVSGLAFSDLELKEHLTNIKKTKGCNGTIKFIETETDKIKVLHIQGNQKMYLYEYFTKLGLQNIKLKG